MQKQTGWAHHKLMKLLLIATALLFVISCQTTGNAASSEEPQSSSKKIYVVGHRGAAGLAPENTLSAFTKACAVGVDAVELDVQLSADGELVVYHDFVLMPEITRTADGAWLENHSRTAINALTLAELKTYDVGRLKPNTRYSRRYPDQQPADGERIPTLREVISTLKDKCDPATRLWIEIKTSPEEQDVSSPPEDVAEAVVKIIRAEKMTESVRILSFDWRALFHVQKIAPEIPTVYLSHVGVRLNNIKPGQFGASPWMAGLDIDDFNGSIPKAVKAAGGRYWAPHYKYVTYAWLKESHRLGIQVYVWTPDSRDDMKRLIEMNVDGIITNRPDILKTLIKRK